MEGILDKTLEIKDWVINIRRDFHQYPELGYEEFRTQGKIIEYLNELGIENHVVAKTGVMGIIRGNAEGKTVALRADIDALPMEDKKDVEYKSKHPGKMHSCGHDSHAAILLGAARVLSTMKEEIKGNVKLFFQPAEETDGGAKPMIEEGVLENPKVDGVFGLHANSALDIGNIQVRYGQMNAASDEAKIIIEGKNSHGAYPQGGIDAIAIAAQVINAIQTIVSRTMDPRSSAVVTIGTIKGGYASNIIAHRVEMDAMVRTLDEEAREALFKRLNDIVHDIPKALGGKGTLIREKGYIALINNDDMVNIVSENATQALGQDSVHQLPHPSFGVEDFSYFAHEVPGAFFNLGTGNSEKGIIHSGHTPEYDIDEDSLVIGVQLQVMNALNFLNK